MDLVKRALLGDDNAQCEITQKGELLPCPCCGNTRIALKHNGPYYYECCNCGTRSISYHVSTNYIRFRWNTRAKVLSEEEMRRLEELK